MPQIYLWGRQHTTQSYNRGRHSKCRGFFIYRLVWYFRLCVDALYWLIVWCVLFVKQGGVLWVKYILLAHPVDSSTTQTELLNYLVSNQLEMQVALLIDY